MLWLVSVSLSSLLRNSPALQETLSSPCLWLLLWNFNNSQANTFRKYFYLWLPVCVCKTRHVPHLHPMPSSLLSDIYPWGRFIRLLLSSGVNRLHVACHWLQFFPRSSLTWNVSMSIRSRIYPLGSEQLSWSLRAHCMASCDVSKISPKNSTVTEWCSWNKLELCRCSEAGVGLVTKSRCVTGKL